MPNYICPDLLESEEVPCALNDNLLTPNLKPKKHIAGRSYAREHWLALFEI